MTWWHKLALGTVPVVGACLCLLLFHTSALIVQTSHDEHAVFIGLQTALDTVNAQCGVAVHCGTLAEMDKVLVHASDLEVQTQILVRHGDRLTQSEAEMLPEWNRHISSTLDGIDRTVGDFNANQSQLTKAVVPILSDLNRTVVDADNLVASPYIADSLHNIDTSTAAIAEGAVHAKDTLADVHGEADKIIAQKKLGFWARLWALL